MDEVWWRLGGGGRGVGSYKNQDVQRNEMTELITQESLGWGGGGGDTVQRTVPKTKEFPSGSEVSRFLETSLCKESPSYQWPG